MTLEEIESSKKDVLTACEVAEVLKCDPQLIRWSARHDPASLGFPVIVMRNRLKIPRLPFLEFMNGNAMQRSSVPAK